MKKLIVLLITFLMLSSSSFAYDYVFSIMGIPGNTQTITASDAVQTLEDLGVTIYTNPPIAVTITCESYNLRFTFGATPSATFGHILYKGQSLRVSNTKAIKSLKFINDDAGSNAVLHVTPEY